MTSLYTLIASNFFRMSSCDTSMKAFGLKQPTDVLMFQSVEEGTSMNNILLIGPTEHICRIGSFAASRQHSEVIP